MCECRGPGSPAQKTHLEALAIAPGAAAEEFAPLLSPRLRPALPGPTSAPISFLLVTFVLETHVCLGAQPGWKGQRHFIAHG